MELLYSWILDQISFGLRPSRSASKTEVRRAGGVLALAGLVLLGVGLTIVWQLRAWLMPHTTVEDGHWTLILVFPGMAAVIVGCYRLVFGCNPEETREPFLRLIAGVLFGLGALVLLTIILVVALLITNN